MAFTRTMTCDGSAIPFPTKTGWGFQDVSSPDSGRTLSGLMSKVVVATKRKLSCSWTMLSDSEASALLKAVKVHTYVSLNYPDAFEGKNVTKTFYTGDATAELIIIDNNTCHWDVSFDFIEQ